MLLKLYIYVAMKIIISLILLTFLFFDQLIVAQQKQDSILSSTLPEVVLTAYEQNRVISCGTIIKVITNNNADRYNKTSLVNSFNSIAGVRMEERSPGSYRINIRGSSIRSPFGVRNIKVYWNDIPVSDAGGNSYFNQFSFNNFSTIEIVKGPAGSMYGAGTGGLLLMQSFDKSWKPSVTLESVTGSFGLKNFLSTVKFGGTNNRNLITFAHTESNGYRHHTKSKRDNFSFLSEHNISDKQKLTAVFLYNNLFYETPGALTYSEFLIDPKSARPSTGGFPSADSAKAAIFQKNVLAGLRHEFHFNKQLKNTLTLYSSFAQIQNPTFRNYERRNEPGFGGRTSFKYENKFNETKITLVSGGEFQEGYFNTRVSKNKNGLPDTLLTNDDIHFKTMLFFAQADINYKDKWMLTSGVSITKSQVGFRRLSRYPVSDQKRNYKSELSPRLALHRKTPSGQSLFLSISRGFSPPGLSELLPSTGIISTFLEPEDGINYELGGRFSLFKGKLRLEATGFYFKLKNTLVTRKDSTNADYFVNAGNTNQKGIEISADYYSTFNSKFFDYITINTALTHNHFKYGDFKKGNTDYSGKFLPGVPKQTFSVLADIQTKKGFYGNTTYYFSTKIFLEDGNAVAALPYHLLGCRAGYKFLTDKKFNINFYIGTDNILNENYSLGNDINAAGSRYYNAAPARNYYTGIALQWHYVKTM